MRSGLRFFSENKGGDGCSAYKTPTSNNQKTEEVLASISTYKQRLRHLQQAGAASCLHPCHCSTVVSHSQETPSITEKGFPALCLLKSVFTSAVWSSSCTSDSTGEASPEASVWLLQFSFPSPFQFRFFSTMYLYFTSCIDRLILLEISVCILWKYTHALFELFKMLTLYFLIHGLLF